MVSESILKMKPLELLTLLTLWAVALGLPTDASSGSDLGVVEPPDYRSTFFLCDPEILGVKRTVTGTIVAIIELGVAITFGVSLGALICLSTLRMSTDPIEHLINLRGEVVVSQPPIPSLFNIIPSKRKRVMNGNTVHASAGAPSAPQNAAIVEAADSPTLILPDPSYMSSIGAPLSGPDPSTSAGGPQGVEEPRDSLDPMAPARDSLDLSPPPRDSLDPASPDARPASRRDSLDPIPPMSADPLPTASAVKPLAATAKDNEKGRGGDKKAPKIPLTRLQRLTRVRRAALCIVAPLVLFSGIAVVFGAVWILWHPTCVFIVSSLIALIIIIVGIIALMIGLLCVGSVILSDFEAEKASRTRVAASRAHGMFARSSVVKGGLACGLRTQPGQVFF